MSPLMWPHSRYVPSATAIHLAKHLVKATSPNIPQKLSRGVDERHGLRRSQIRETAEWRSHVREMMCILSANRSTFEQWSICRG